MYLCVQDVKYNNAKYILQLCHPKSTDWIEVASSDSDSLSVFLNRLRVGDKLRCLIEKDDRVVNYTNSITVGTFDLFHYNRNQNSFGNSSHYYQWKSQDNYDDEHYPFDNLDGYEFESFCAQLLREIGFSNVSITPSSGDYGADILAEFGSDKYAIQCKCYEGLVGTKAVQEIFTGKAYYNCDIAVVITNSYFSKPAISMAKKIGVKLWDRQKLISYCEKAADNNGASKHDSDSSDKYSDYSDYMNDAMNGFSNEEGSSQQTKEKEVQEMIDKIINEYSYFRGCHNIDQIKSRHRILMKQYHPDINKGSEYLEITKIINGQRDELVKRLGRLKNRND